MKMSKKSVFSVIQFVFFLSLGVFLLWLSTRNFSEKEIDQVKKGVLTADLRVAFLCVLLLLLSHFIRALRWKTMIVPLGKNPTTLNVFLTVLIGYFMNLLFPRLGEIMKCTLLGKYEKVPVDKLIGTIVAERVIDLICLVVVIFMTIVTQFETVGNYAKETGVAIIEKFNLSFSGLAIFLFAFVILVWGVQQLLKRPKGKGLAAKLTGFIGGIYEGLMSIRKVQNKPMFFLHTLAIWLLYYLSIRMGFGAMDELSMLGFVPALTILTFGSFAMIATQGGIGAYQIIVQKTLTLYEIGEVSGLAFGWLLWSVQTIMLLFIGPVAMAIIFFINRKTKMKT